MKLNVVPGEWGQTCRGVRRGDHLLPQTHKKKKKKASACRMI